MLIIFSSSFQQLFKVQHIYYYSYYYRTVGVVIMGCLTLILPKFPLVYSLRMASLPLNMIYLKCQEKYFWCFYGILRQLLLMSPLAFATMSGAPMFSETAACWETLHRQGRGTWDESVHMCHAGGHRQCAISDSFPAMSPYHRTATAPKTKIILPRDEAKTAKACAVRLRNSPKHCWACENSSTLWQ